MSDLSLIEICHLIYCNRLHSVEVLKCIFTYCSSMSWCSFNVTWDDANCWRRSQICSLRSPRYTPFTLEIIFPRPRLLLLFLPFSALLTHTYNLSTNSRVSSLKGLRLGAPSLRPLTVIVKFRWYETQQEAGRYSNIWLQSQRYSSPGADKFHYQFWRRFREGLGQVAETSVLHDAGTVRAGIV